MVRLKITRRQKQNRLSSIRRRMRRNNVEPHILEVVVLLNALGYETFMSCQGHLWRNRRFDRPFIGPSIDFWVGYVPEDADMTGEEFYEFLGEATKRDLTPKEERWLETFEQATCRYRQVLLELLQEFYTDRSGNEDVRLTLSPPDHSWGMFTVASQGMWSASYPTEQQATRQKAYRAEMNALSAFLQRKYFE